MYMAKKKQLQTNTGFPLLERLLEQEKPDLSRMKAHYELLIKKSKVCKKPQEKIAAKQAAIAYEHFFELVNHLVKVRSKLI